jgi:WD40 repeat protein
VSFNGFISYSHAADGRLAPAVQRGLHQLAKPWHRRRALWVFRDQTGLAVTPGLWSSIQKALDGSEWFILMASPEAARSQWVNREIEHWVAMKPADRILPVVTGGEWRWDPSRGDFAEDSTAVPSALRGVFAEEPLFLDLRWAREDQHLSLRHSRFRDAVAQLAAPMHGVSKDDLEGEDVRQHRTAQRLRAAAVTAVVVLGLMTSLSGAFAVRSAGKATAAAAEALRQQRVAAKQKGSAERSAADARWQEKNARTQEKRAKDAGAEARRQDENARQQAENARKQQALADQASARAREQERLAQQQRELAKHSAADATRQKQVADGQERLAQEASAEAARQKELAREQQRLADEAAKDAARQKQAAEEERRKADEAAADARRQQDNADRQQRIAVGRRANNEAKAALADDPKTAVMLSTAAAKVQSDEEARKHLAGLVTSTHYAGPLGHFVDVAYLGNDVLLAQDNSRLRLWNVADRANPSPVADLGGYDQWTASPNGRTVAAAAYNGSSVFLLDVTKPSASTPLAEIPVSSGVSSLTISPDGRTLFVGAQDWSANDVGDLWDVSDLRRPKPLATRFDGSAFVAKAAFSWDGTALVTLDDDAKTTVWNLADPTKPEKAAALDGTVCSEGVNAMAFLPRAPELVIGCNDHTLLVDLSNPAEPTGTVLMADVGGKVTSLLVSADGRRLATGVETVVSRGIESGFATVSELGGASPGVPRELVRVPEPGKLRAMALTPDGRTLTTSDGEALTRQWNVDAYGAPESRSALTSGGQQGLATAFTPDGRSMLTVGSNPQAAVWDVSHPSAPVRRASPTVHDKPIYRAAITPDARILATADADGRVRVSDMSDPAHPATIAEFVAQVIAQVGSEGEIVISPDGRTIAAGTEFGSPVLWDVTRAGAVTRLRPLGNSVMPMAFGPDGRTVAIADRPGSGASLWTLDGAGGPTRVRPIGALGGASVGTIAFSPDGGKVAMVGWGTGGLWDVSQARSRQTGAFSIRGATGSAEFSRDGRTLAILGQYNTALWDVAGGVDPVQVGEIPLDADLVSFRLTATFSPDGRTLATGKAGYTGSEGIAALWDLTKLAWLRADPTLQGCAITGRGLSEDEWARYIPELPHRKTCPH